MTIHFKYLMLHFIGFIRNPNDPDYLVLTERQKLLHICFYFLFISMGISLIVFGLPLEIAEKLGLFDELVEKDINVGIIVKTITAIILAPFIEEIMFRFWLGYFRHWNYFKWLYYISALLFGGIHIFNYEFNNSHYFFIPFITMGQTFGGLMLGYIRIIYGFWYGVLLHALFNSLVIGGYFIFENQF